MASTKLLLPERPRQQQLCRWLWNHSEGLHVVLTDPSALLESPGSAPLAALPCSLELRDILLISTGLWTRRILCETDLPRNNNN